jgi:hypothetical protein
MSQAELLPAARPHSNIRNAALIEALRQALSEALTEPAPPAEPTRKGPQIDGIALTPEEFCLKNKISRSSPYAMWRAGTGPKYYKAGRSTRIAPESAVAWRREREAAAVLQAVGV